MSFRTRRRVEFRDTDAAGIVHFSAFFPYMEAAEHEMLRSLGIAVLPAIADPGGRDVADTQAAPGVRVTWPRVSASCDYQAAARFEDVLEINVSVARIGRSSVHYQFDFARTTGDGQPPVPVATGRIVVVCCQLSPGGGLEKMDLPAGIRRKLESL